MIPDIFISNTLGGKKTLFKPLKPGKVSMYACGVTTYDHYHIGHALQAIYFDMIRNYLEFVGYDVTYVRNYTDVDDKIINRAKEQGISPAALAKNMIASSEEDMTALECRAANHAPKVSESIPQIIAMVETLIKNAAAYATKSGDVYYRVRAKKDYGKLSNRRPDELQSGSRDIVLGEKEDELDFALWKCDNTPDASWPSPWGQGRPGWHIECSAMAKEFLGSSFDIHGGGRDLVFPHHENEIAQSESANKAPFASIWMHCGLLTINKQKMSKSLGNHITVKDFLKKYPTEVLRLAFLQFHYTSNIDFSNNTFINAHKRLYYYYATLLALDELGQKSPSGAKPKADFDPAAIRQRFCTAMNDDLNAAQALGGLNNDFRKVQDLLKEKASPEKFATAKALAAEFRTLFKVFGLLQKDPKESLETLRVMLLPELGITKPEILKQIEARKKARQDKDFAKADELRKALQARGIELMDTQEGTDWKIAYEQ
jgi:cysteinyl-tRNA synthetase